MCDREGRGHLPEKCRLWIEGANSLAAWLQSSSLLFFPPRRTDQSTAWHCSAAGTGRSGSGPVFLWWWWCGPQSPLVVHQSWWMPRTRGGSAWSSGRPYRWWSRPGPLGWWLVSWWPGLRCRCTSLCHLQTEARKIFKVQVYLQAKHATRGNAPFGWKGTRHWTLMIRHHSPDWKWSQEELLSLKGNKKVKNEKSTGTKRGECVIVQTSSISQLYSDQRV